MPSKNQRKSLTRPDFTEPPSARRNGSDEFGLAESLAIMGNIVGGTAHTFNNILSGILGYSQLLQQALDPSTRAFRHAGVIEKGAKRATKLISQLHLFSNREYVFRKVLVKPKKLVETVLSAVSRSFDPNISVNVELNHGSERLLADFRSLTQVFINLVSNAADAMPNGGELLIKTAISDKRDPVADSVKRYVAFRIIDTGIGIREDRLRRIFEPFYTSKKTLSKSGLGLTLAKAIVIHHQGHINVQSRIGEGSRFHVYLPTPKAANGVPLEIDNKGEQILDKEKVIMVVDDEDDLRELAKTIFERKGFRVLLAESAQDAIEVFEENAQKIALVILDIVLPGIDGDQVYQKLKRSRAKPKILLTSGYNKSSPALKFIQDCDENFVSKPWDVPALISQVRKLVNAS